MAKRKKLFSFAFIKRVSQRRDSNDGVVLPQPRRPSSTRRRRTPSDAYTLWTSCFKYTRSRTATMVDFAVYTRQAYVTRDSCAREPNAAAAVIIRPYGGGSCCSPVYVQPTPERRKDDRKWRAATSAGGLRVYTVLPSHPDMTDGCCCRLQ